MCEHVYGNALAGSASAIAGYSWEQGLLLKEELQQALWVEEILPVPTLGGALPPLDPPDERLSVDELINGQECPAVMVFADC